MPLFILFLAQTHAVLSAPSIGLAPKCSLTGRPAVTKVSALPPSVQRALKSRIADPSAPFHNSDVVLSGQEKWPFMRLICGYRVPGGYVVEREQGGRGYNLGKIIFRRTARGYEQQN